jgi:hypothetical protein
VDAASAVAVAATFVWLGMVLAISFLEAPLKFRAPGVSTQIGLGIGRLVFRALNTAEAVLALAVVASFVADAPSTPAVVAGGLAAAVLAGQILAVRPALSRRSDAVLRGADGPRSHAHLVYVGLECVKVAALLVTGVALVTS